MSSTRKTEDAAKSLSKIALEPSKRQELWDAIDQRIDMDTKQNDVTTSVPKRRNRSSWRQLSAAVAALVLIASGITYGAHYEGLLKATRSTGDTNIISIPTPKSTIELTLTLPNGQTVKPDQTVTWKDLSLSLIITSLPPANASSQIFGFIMGDGTNRISQETVSTSIGSGELWYTKRKDSTYAYYTIVNGNQNAYVLQAVVTGNPSNAKSEVTSLLNSLHVSGGDEPAQQGNSSYAKGLTKTQTPKVPTGYKASVLPKNGIAEIVSSTGHGVVTYGQPWTTITDFSSSPISINGIDYTVPKQYQNMQLFVLPIDTGIVWAPTNQRNLDMRKLDLTGYTDIYFTPYRSSDASLSDGAQLIAQVPHKWTGFDGPVVGSAWAGWLPRNSVVMPKVQSEVVRQLSYSSINNMEVVGQHTKNFSSTWSSLFMQNVPQNPSSKADYSADVGSLIQTSGGFVLQVGFTDATSSGRNSGMQGQGAYYYWSEKTRKWTPLTQLYMVQTITGDLSVGSGAVYWEEAVPDSQGGNQNILDVAQMHYDPQTNTMQSIWLGNWYYSTSYVDGISWITVLPNDMKPAGTQPMFTVFTP